jgi:GH25 family lysozyme M1 (1,4-beta-N-acetylmuramidase)
MHTSAVPTDYKDKPKGYVRFNLEAKDMREEKKNALREFLKYLQKLEKYYDKNT